MVGKSKHGFSDVFGVRTRLVVDVVVVVVVVVSVVVVVVVVVVVEVVVVVVVEVVVGVEAEEIITPGGFFLVEIVVLSFKLYLVLGSTLK